MEEEIRKVVGSCKSCGGSLIKTENPSYTTSFNTALKCVVYCNRCGMWWETNDED
jgi:RNase P subunit RPR2